ncbi:hypothetical protein HQ587_03765 [bacterium]|nr:hypothetical protein [bacterium]
MRLEDIHEFACGRICLEYPSLIFCSGLDGKLSLQVKHLQIDTVLFLEAVMLSPLLYHLQKGHNLERRLPVLSALEIESRAMAKFCLSVLSLYRFHSIRFSWRLRRSELSEHEENGHDIVQRHLIYHRLWSNMELWEVPFLYNAARKSP